MDENKQEPTQTPAPTPPAPNPTPPPSDPAPTPPVNQPLAAAQPAGPPKNKNMMLAIIAVAILVVAGVAYGVYAYVTNTPDYLLSRAVDQFGKEPNNAMAAKFKVVSGTEGTGMSFSGDFAVRGDAANKNGEAVVGFGSGDSRVTLTARSIDEALFLKAGSLTNLPNLLKSFSPEAATAYDSPQMKTALARIDGKWFSLTKEDIQNLGGGTTVTSDVSPQELQQVLDIYRKHKVFQVDKTYADEKVDNVATGHFTVKVDKNELVSFLTDVKNANLKSFKVTDAEIQSAGKDADDFAKNAVVDVWVTRDTKKFKQIRFASVEKGSEGAFTLTFVTELPQFDKLEKPADAQPLSELLTTFLGPQSVNLDQNMMAQ